MKVHVCICVGESVYMSVHKTVGECMCMDVCICVYEHVCNCSV